MNVELNCLFSCCLTASFLPMNIPALPLSPLCYPVLKSHKSWKRRLVCAVSWRPLGVATLSPVMARVHRTQAAMFCLQEYKAGLVASWWIGYGSQCECCAIKTIIFAHTDRTKAGGRFWRFIENKRILDTNTDRFKVQYCLCYALLRDRTVVSWRWWRDLRFGPPDL